MVNAVNKVFAIIVTYNANLKAIETLLEAVTPQVNKVFVVDNTEKNSDDLHKKVISFSKATFIPVGQNKGIAYAQNIGIEKAILKGAEYVILLDQDSAPYPDMVAQLLNQLEISKNNYPKIGAIGPVCIDPRNSTNLSFIASKFGFPYRFNPLTSNSALNVVRLGFLISSGSLISVDCIKDVGGKRSNYFIDHVDTEWCLRARASGYTLLGSTDSFMSHSIGDETRKLGLFFSRNIPYHSPLRDYYMFRNTFLVLRDVKSFFNWKIALIFRLIQFMAYFLIFVPDRMLRLKFMLKGIVHGLMFRSGKLDPVTLKCIKIENTVIDPIP